jgi:hypothetical protein
MARRAALVVNYLVNAPDPMLLLRLPDPAPPWTTILKALSPTPRSFYNLLPVNAALIREQLESAFAGGKEFAGYTLFDWRDGGFVRVR